MSRSYHSRDYYDGYNRRRSEVRNAKRRKRIKKVIREEMRKKGATADKFGSVAFWPCTRKRRFKKRIDAVRWMERHPQYKGLSLYRCDYCGGWHLTSHPWHAECEEDTVEPQDIVLT